MVLARSGNARKVCRSTGESYNTCGSMCRCLHLHQHPVVDNANPNLNRAERSKFFMCLNAAKGAKLLRSRVGDVPGD